MCSVRGRVCSVYAHLFVLGISKLPRFVFVCLLVGIEEISASVTCGSFMAHGLYCSEFPVVC